MQQEQDQALIARVYGRALELRAADRRLGSCEQVIYEVEMLSQEVNSGASFEQYFRWASVSELHQVDARLQALGLDDVAALVRRACAVAFPQGLPQTEDALERATLWTPGQRVRLALLGEEFCAFNPAITAALAALYRREAPLPA